MTQRCGPARMTLSSTALTLATSLFVGPMAATSSASDAGPRLSADQQRTKAVLEERLDAGVARLLETRTETETRSVTAAVTALQRLGGTRSDTSTPPGSLETLASPPIAEKLSTYAPAERTFHRTVLRLLAAIDLAKEIQAVAMRRGPSGDADAETRLPSLRDVARTDTEENILSALGVARSGRVSGERPGFVPDMHLPEGSRGDRDLLLEAAKVVTQAIDENIPALKGFAALQPSTPGRLVDGCDVVDLLPTLCIGGTDSNKYTDDAELLISLGGDDTYLNSAGGADPVLGNGLQVSVAIDLGGNDTYKGVLPLKSGSRVAQGSGADGGVGILADLDGDDSYSISARPKQSPPDSLGAVGQGSTFVSGVGLLIDLQGSDSYVASSPNPGSARGVLSQGAAAGSGGGALLDFDGDDRYRASVRPRSTVRPPRNPLDSDLNPTQVTVAAMGFGSNQGVGLLGDLAGKDSFTLSAKQSMRVRGTEFVLTGASLAAGLGTGLGGAGGLLLGAGNAKAIATADISMRRAPLFDPLTPPGRTPLPLPPPQATVFAFGAGSTGFGGLSDAGGDDQYVAKTTARGFERAGAASTSAAMGVGVLGVGVLHDAGGADRYLSSADARGYADATGVAVGQGGALIGAGGLVDLDGDDLYQGTTRGEISSTVLSNDPDFADGLAVTGAQAFGQQGLGVLTDFGGADSYSSRNSFLLNGANFILNRAAREVNAFSFVQAAVATGVARFEDIDRSAKDRFRAAPENPACLGTRGTSTWRDCGGVSGEGSVRDLP